MFDEKALARLGAVGLTWSDETGFVVTSDRAAEQSRPWSPAPAESPDDRILRPGHATAHGADPADVDQEPQEGR